MVTAQLSVYYLGRLCDSVVSMDCMLQLCLYNELLCLNESLVSEIADLCRRFQSIPAFTANYTMDQFQKQTQC